MAWISFMAALIASLLFIPALRALGLRTGRVAQPRPDRWHQRPTATTGGIGIFLAFLAGLLLSALLARAGRVAGGGEPYPAGILLGVAAVFFLGLYDDLKRISPPAKLIGQILAAAIVIASGYTTQFFTPRLENSLLAGLPNILLTFFWLVGITNAINLLDNMDGLAGGISLIAAAILSFFFWRSGDLVLLSLSLALAGSLLGFLVFNFPPASIFMGDSGSLFLGFSLAVLAVARQPQASNVIAVMGAPTLLFLLPILDTTLVMFTRLLRGQSPMQGGRDHTSHRLIAFGLSERGAVLVLYGVALASGVLAALVESIQYWLSLVVVPVLVVSLALLTAYLGGLKVVAAPGSRAAGGGLTRVMLNLTYRRRVLEVILDFFLIGLAYYLAVLAWAGFRLDDAGFAYYLRTLPVAVASAFSAFFLFGVYRGVWRYVGIDEFMRYFLAALGSLALVAAAQVFLSDLEDISTGALALFPVFLFLLLALSRSSFRVLDRLSKGQVRPEEQRVLVYGAGDAGEMALRWISMNPQLNYRPVALLDDDPLMAGRRIHGVGVLGGLDQLESALPRLRIQGVILAQLDAGQAVQQQVVAACEVHGCWVSVLRLEFEPVRKGYNGAQ